MANRDDLLRRVRPTAGGTPTPLQPCWSRQMVHWVETCRQFDSSNTPPNFSVLIFRTRGILWCQVTWRWAAYQPAGAELSRAAADSCTHGLFSGTSAAPTLAVNRRHVPGATSAATHASDSAFCKYTQLCAGLTETFLCAGPAVTCPVEIHLTPPQQPAPARYNSLPSPN